MFPLLLLLFTMLWASFEGANILVIAPYRGHSHSIGPLKIADALWKRGHKLTVASFFPKSGHLENYTSISLQAENVEVKAFFDVPDEVFSTLDNFIDFYLERYIYIPVMENEKFRTLRKQHFDLILFEYFQTEMLFALIRDIDAPFILVHTTVPYPWQNDLFAEPHCESYIPHLLSSEAGPGMLFFQRMTNFIELHSILAAYNYFIVKDDQRIAEKYFGPLPNLRHISREASLFFINSHHSMTVPKPINPSTIEIGGIHIDPPKPLPKEVQQILDKANGVVFFSLGSIMKGSSLSAHKKDIIMNTFNGLKETILWKWEGDFPDKPTNVYTSKWFPQRDIFAHPKISLYIGHCGILGLQEAIYEAVPVLCLPFFADQHVNAKYLKASGVGLFLNFASLDENNFRTLVVEMLQNSSYKENARRISAAFRDRPMSPMDTAVYWTEYVLRHEGARHLKSPARYMTWVEYNNIDVVVTLLCSILFTVYALTKVFVAVLRWIVSKGKLKKD